MFTKYLIPQFIIDYLQKSRSIKNPKILASASLIKNKTPEIEKWFKGNAVNASYIWKSFVSRGKTEFYHKTCEVCGERISLKEISKYPNRKFCSPKCQANSKEVREKRKQTNLEKYGVENPFQSKKVQERRKQTCLEKYGVENPFQLEEIKEKFKYTQRFNRWKTFCFLLSEKDIIPLFTKKDYINDTGRKFKCLKCGEEFDSEGTNNYKKEHPNKDGSYTTLIPYDIFCPYCFKAPVSKKEKDVMEFVKSVYKGEIQENIKGLFPSNPRMEIDIYLPSLNLGIEFDGTYWHSTDVVKEKDEHKNALCEQNEIRLLRIKESDWDNNPQKVKEEIQTFINLK